MYITMINKIDILNIQQTIKKKSVHRIVLQQNNKQKKATETFRHGPKVELYIVTPCEFLSKKRNR